MPTRETYRDARETHLTIDADPEHDHPWKCPYCGHVVKRNLAYCPECGTERPMEK
jgi:rubrerythrin